jgi:hypothetical protein
LQAEPLLIPQVSRIPSVIRSQVTRPPESRTRVIWSIEIRKASKEGFSWETSLEMPPERVIRKTVRVAAAIPPVEVKRKSE